MDSERKQTSYQVRHPETLAAFCHGSCPYGASVVVLQPFGSSFIHFSVRISTVGGGVIALLRVTKPFIEAVMDLIHHDGLPGHVNRKKCSKLTTKYRGCEAFITIVKETRMTEIICSVKHDATRRPRSPAIEPAAHRSVRGVRPRAVLPLANDSAH